ncbi:CCL4 protein, partial [Oxyruncus cristatus]|nr:CCL4 protein [Oxyruncus cristatus]
AHYRPVECCFQYAQKPIRQAKSYYETPINCTMPAVVIVAASGAKICADPEKRWVKKAIERLQKQ